MINDARWVFSDQQDMNGTGAVASTDLTDLGLADPNQGAGSNFYIRAVCDSDFAGGTDITASLQDCDTEGGSYVDIVVGPKIDLADLKQGVKILDIKLPEVHRKFLKLSYDRTGTFTGGHGINAYANVTP